MLQVPDIEKRQTVIRWRVVVRGNFIWKLKLVPNPQVLFGHNVFCTIWAVFWEIIPFYSVFLVGFLSFTRLTTLLKPNIKLSPYVIPLATTLYLLILVSCKGGSIAAHFLDPSHHDHESHRIFDYNKHSVYCFLYARGFGDPRSWTMYAITSTAFMAGPIPLILSSCLASLFKIRQATSRAKHLSSSIKMQREASITIVIVTFTYLLYNVPVFINYTAYTIASFHSEVDYKDMYGSNSALFYYAWVTTYVVCVALNALTNPVVYFFRMTGYRNYLMAMMGMAVLSRDATYSNSNGDYSSRKDASNMNNGASLKVHPTTQDQDVNI